jgi:hypothetical protein
VSALDMVPRRKSAPSIEVTDFLQAPNEGPGVRRLALTKCRGVKRFTYRVCLLTYQPSEFSAVDRNPLFRTAAAIFSPVFALELEAANRLDVCELRPFRKWHTRFCLGQFRSGSAWARLIESAPAALLCLLHHTVQGARPAHYFKPKGTHMKPKPLSDTDAATVRAAIKRSADIASMASATRDMAKHHETLIEQNAKELKERRAQRIAASWDKQVNKPRVPVGAVTVDLGAK